MLYFKPIYLTTFFFVSGYLFKDNVPFLDMLEQRTRTLLIPFVVFGTLMIIMQHLLTFKDDLLPWHSAFKGLLLQNGENQLLWFIAALYIYSIFFFWIERFAGNYLLLATIVLFVGNWCYEYVIKGPSIPWHISTAGYGCAYMALGKIYRRYENAAFLKMRFSSLLGLTICYFVLVGILHRSYSYTGSVMLLDSIIITCIGLIVIIEICKRKPFVSSRLLLFVGSNTLFYFAFHGKGYALLENL